MMRTYRLALEVSGDQAHGLVTLAVRGVTPTDAIGRIGNRPIKVDTANGRLSFDYWYVSSVGISDRVKALPCMAYAIVDHALVIR